MLVLIGRAHRQDGILNIPQSCNAYALSNIREVSVGIAMDRFNR